MDRKQSLRTDLVQAWNFLVDDTITTEHLALLSDSLKGDEYFREFETVFERVWNEAHANKPYMTEERKDAYRREADRIITEYARKRSLLPKHIPSRNVLHRFRKVWYAAAAAILLGALIPAVWLSVKPTTEQAETVVGYIEAVTGRGEIKTIVLPDQTKVTLNVESSLKYPDVFTDSPTVELQGGAIFEVPPDSLRKFTVITTELNVKVLGTVFDVKAYPDDASLFVSVASGKVEVTSTVAVGHAPLSSNAPLYIEEDQQIRIDKATGNFEKYTIDAQKYLLWTDGVLYFNKTPIREVVNTLNRSYPQLVFELAEDEHPTLISGRLDTKNLEAMLDPVIRSFELRYKKTGNKIVLYRE